MSDYPRGVVRVEDNNGETADRYSALFGPENLGGEVWYSMITMEAERPGAGNATLHQHKPPRRGLLIRFADLPGACQRCIEGWITP